MHVLVSTHAEDPSYRAHAAEIRSVVDALEEHSVVETPSDAEVILFVESPENKFRRWTEMLMTDPVVMGNLDRCFVRDGSDRPVPFLPGLYWSMPRSRFDPGRVVAVGPWIELTPELRAHVDADAASEPLHLYSFRGFNSHPVRNALARLGSPATPVTLTNRFWDFEPSEGFRRDYLVELRNSRFVLCPRGLGPATVRVYEAMELGRVPVVISDEWVPPSGPDWDTFSIRVPEEAIDRLPGLLAEADARAEQMGRAARAAWETWFRPGPTQVSHWLESIRGLIDHRPRDWSPTEISRSWTSHRFQWRHGIHPAQGAAARARRVARQLR